MRSPRPILAHRPLVFAISLVVAWSAVGCSTNADAVAACDDPGDPLLVLLAQAVPSATAVPCVAAIPAGWSFHGSEVRDGRALMWLGTIEANRIVELAFTRSCDPGDAVEVVPGSDEVGAVVLQAPESLDPFRGQRFVVFEGGCVTMTFTFPPGMPASHALEADSAFSFVPRADVVAAVADEDGATLCGTAAPPCEGA